MTSMRGMNSESVDLIYLDPPFNSNKTYSAPIGSKAAGAAFKDTGVTGSRATEICLTCWPSFSDRAGSLCDLPSY